MRWPGRTIWDTRIQGVCGIISAYLDGEVHLFGSASFAQLTLEPPRVIINPNRMHGIEEAVRKSGCFAINVLPKSSRNLMIELMGMRRREPEKASLLGLNILDNDGIPYLEGNLRTVFCEVERAVEGGDRRLYIGRVLESRQNPNAGDSQPLLFTRVTDKSKRPGFRQGIRTAAIRSGALDAMKLMLKKVRTLPPANIAATTYQEAGATTEEVDVILAAGVVDRSRHLRPPANIKVPRKSIGVCVVGTGWGQTHVKYLRWASPDIRLFVCGQNRDKTNRVAKALGAEGTFYSLEEAVNDSRVAAVTLALPHHLHRSALEVVAAAGKHALVEKPIATNLEDADAMIAMANKAGIIFMVAEDMHFRPAIRKAIELINAGQVGEPLYLLAHAGGIRRPSGWAADKSKMGGGVLVDIGVHYVRALRLLMGEPDQVFASRAMQINTKISGEDSAQVLFSSRFGWEAHMVCSWSSQRGNLPDLVVAGEKGTIHLWPTAQFVDYYPIAPRPITSLLSYVRPFSLQAKLMKPTLQRVRSKLTDKDPTGYLGEMKEFVTAVIEHRQPATLPIDARRDLEIIERCYESLVAREYRTVPAIDE